MDSRKYLLLVWIAAMVNFHESGAAPDTTRGTSYAVVIGISAYENPQLPSLQFADKDATLFASYLRTRNGGNLPVSNIRLLLNEEATIAAIYDALNWLKTTCSENDKAYFYFSGHGDIETQNKFSLGYLLAYNSPPNNYPNNAIAIEAINEVANYLSANRKASVILVTDACHTGKLAGDYYKGRALIASQLKLILNNEVRIAACGVDEKAVEGTEWGGGRGVFSYYLLRGLNGLADFDRNDTIQLAELTTYLDSAFATDNVLIRNKLQQRPMLDGNPYQPMAVLPAPAVEQTDQETTSHFQTALTAFKPVGIQPIDYFFRTIKSKAVESRLRFDKYDHVATDSLPLIMIDDCIIHQIQLDSLALKNPNETSRYNFASKDSLAMLRQQLTRSKALTGNFMERFIQMVHGQAQDMVNAYLQGDEAELEKRQYYYAGNRRYRDFLAMFRVAWKLTPAQHYLKQLLTVQEAYLSGLVARLELANRGDAKLLAAAFSHQRRALQLEPYAAYIYNEIGNLHLRSNQFALAARYYKTAMEYAPTWAIPWSNEIRLRLATGELPKATVAIKIADSLQNNLAYTWMNAGMVMAKSNNLLMAESDFQKAVSKNSVHFLPFQQLAELYMKTGDFRKADQFFSATHTRRKNFAINDRSFKYGIELGGPPLMAATEQNLPGDLPGNLMPNAPPYTRLIHALAVMQSGSDSLLGILASLTQELNAGKHLAFHYAGKILYDRNEWTEALPFLVEASRNYQNDSTLLTLLSQEVHADKPASAVAIPFQYDQLADHYLLASIYEHLGNMDSALSEYALISSVENQRQFGQAVFQGYDSKLNSHDLTPDFQELIARYESPVPMGGYLKQAQIFERSGNYERAEKIYLEQITLNRQAGDLRRRQSKQGPFQQMAGVNINFYWLAINRTAEAQTYAFYERMLRRYARDSDWQRKAGMFLYNRLQLAFGKATPEKYKAIYESITYYAYPFTMADETGIETEIVFTLLGTNEQIRIATPKYDPLKKALQSLELSAKLSGDRRPDPKTLEAIADLQSWMADDQAAVESYRELIAVAEPDAQLRSKIIRYCLGVYEYPLAVEQLKILYRLGNTSVAQNLKLAECYSLAGQPEQAARILDATSKMNLAPQYDLNIAYAKMNWLSRRYAKALYHLNRIPVPEPETSGNDSTRETLAQRYYTVARLNALIKQKEKALTALDSALSSGFDLGYVLRSDPAWNALRTSREWDRIKRRHIEQFAVKDYIPQSFDGWQSVLEYRIPN